MHTARRRSSLDGNCWLKRASRTITSKAGNSISAVILDVAPAVKRDGLQTRLITECRAARARRRRKARYRSTPAAARRLADATGERLVEQALDAARRARRRRRGRRGRASRARKHSSAMFSAASTARRSESVVGRDVGRRADLLVDVGRQLRDVRLGQRAPDRVLLPEDLDRRRRESACRFTGGPDPETRHRSALELLEHAGHARPRTWSRSLAQRRPSRPRRPRRRRAWRSAAARARATSRRVLLGLLSRARPAACPISRRPAAAPSPRGDRAARVDGRVGLPRSSSSSRSPSIRLSVHRYR